MTSQKAESNVRSHAPKSSPSKSSPNKQALGIIKPSTTMWHHRLGHASTPVVQQVLNRHRLPFVKNSNKILNHSLQRNQPNRTIILLQVKGAFVSHLGVVYFWMKYSVWLLPAAVQIFASKPVS